MVDDGLAKCENCQSDFAAGSTMRICSECEGKFCEDCWKEHRCTEDEYSELETTCTDCGSSCNSEEIKICNKCEESVCESCWEDHCHNHLDEDSEEILYEDWVDQEVQEKI